MTLAKVLTASALFLTSSAITYAQHAKDILGITVGMSFEEAKSKITKSGLGYTIKTPKGEDPAITYLVAYKMNEEGWSLEAIDGKVVFVQHEKFFHKGNQPIGTGVYNDLIAKYGTPGDDPRVRSRLTAPILDVTGSYLFDQNGNPMAWGLYGMPPTRYSPKTTCDINSSSNVSINDNTVTGTNLGFPARLTPGCHQILDFRIIGFQQFVSALNMQEIDQDLIQKEYALAGSKEWQSAARH